MANIQVTNINDSGAGSLRQAIADANSGDTIVFSIPNSSTIVLTSGQINVPTGKNLTIDGTTATNLVISGNNASRIFNLNATSVQPTSFTVRSLTLANGNAGGNNGGAIATTGEFQTITVDNVTFNNNQAGQGGAIASAFNGTLTVTNSRFNSNQAISTNSEQGGGAIFFFGPGQLTVQGSTFEGNRGINGGAINNLAGRVTIENSTFRNNDVLAAQFATGQNNDFLRGYGGAIYSDRVSPANDPAGGTFQITNSTFESNQSRAAGGALYLFTGAQDGLAIQNSTFLNNSAIGLPGGERGNGGALELQSNDVNRGVTIAGSTFAGNRSVDRGGAIRIRNFPSTIYNNTFDDNRTTLPGTANFDGGLGGAIEASGNGASTITNNTFSNNFATWTGGAILAGVPLRADNNIFFNNSTNTFNNGNPILSHIDGNNLSGSNNIQFPNNRGGTNNEAIPGGTITADPLLAPLANNGGLTGTRALQTGSPAINAGSNAGVAPDRFDANSNGNTTEGVPFDQRGAGFSRVQGGTVDIGAFESGTVATTPILAIAATNADQTEGNSGTKPFTFTVTRTGNTSTASSAQFAVTGSGANASTAADFGGTLPTGTVDFAAGATTATVTVNVNGDTDVEPDEGFTVTLSNPTNATIATATATGTIRNDDAAAPGTPSLAIIPDTPDRLEVNTGITPFPFTVTRSGDLSGTSSVQYAVTGSGTNPADATDFGGTLPTGTVNFAAGQATATVTVNVSGDTTVEPDEGFTVTLSNPTNATITTATATRTIRNDDAAAPGTPSLAIADVAIIEGNSGTQNAVFTVALSAPSTQTVTVDYATANGTGTAGTDYVATSGTLSFTPNTTSQTITVVINGDTLVEPNNTFLVNLSNPTNATIADNQGVGTIQNDDGPANQPPVNTVPTGQNINQNQTLAFSASNGNAVSVNDPDAGSNPLQVALSVTNGVIALANLSGVTIVNGANNSSNLTVAGTLSALNTALSSLSFIPTPGFTGNAALTFTTNDQGSGVGVPEIVTSTVNIAVAAGTSQPPTAGLSVNNSNTFTVGGSGNLSQLLLSLVQTSGTSVNEIGVFKVDDDQGTVNGISPGGNGYLAAVLSRSEVAFSTIANRPNGFGGDLQRVLDFAPGDRFRFYLVQNSTTDSVQSGRTSGDRVLFSTTTNIQIANQGNSTFAVSWEDGTGPVNFQDLVLQVQPTTQNPPIGTGLQGNPQAELFDLRSFQGQQIRAEFNVYREAAFDNFIGFYRVNDAQGAVTDPLTGATIAPGQAGYAQAALRARVQGVDLTVANQATAVLTNQIAGGSILAPFIIANGRPDALLDANTANDPAIYFPFLSANSDGVDHIRLLADNTFGFEDLPGGGDLDYNDIVVSAKFTTV